MGRSQDWKWSSLPHLSSSTLPSPTTSFPTSKLLACSKSTSSLLQSSTSWTPRCTSMAWQFYYGTRISSAQGRPWCTKCCSSILLAILHPTPTPASTSTQLTSTSNPLTSYSTLYFLPAPLFPTLCLAVFTHALSSTIQDVSLTSWINVHSKSTGCFPFYAQEILHARTLLYDK